MKFRPLVTIVVLIGVGVVTALAIRNRIESTPVAVALPVPAGDREIAWFNTTTGGATWERFVAGIHRANILELFANGQEIGTSTPGHQFDVKGKGRTPASALKAGDQILIDNAWVVLDDVRQILPDLEIDDSKAFLESTTAIPEVVVSWKDRPGKLRIRWYKQTNETSTQQWIDALAQREPPPLAIIGGGSSDRARDLANELNERTQWKGPRPLLLITTATANDVPIEGTPNFCKLTQVYPDRTFRFCFTNEQMARAVTDFIWNSPRKEKLRPRGGMPAETGVEAAPIVFPVFWNDDPYSEDLQSKFGTAIRQITQERCNLKPATRIEFSVGSFDRANSSEASGAKAILEDDDRPFVMPEQRSLLILPAGTAPARRFLRALTGASPLIGRNLVAVNGDAISINDIYRDGALQWNIHDLPVPLVFFAHQNPVGWTEKKRDWDAELSPPAGTDETLFFARMFEVLIQTTFPRDDTPVADADMLAERIRKQRIVLFDDDGNRKDGHEYVVYLQPDISDAGRIQDQAALEVWQRSRGSKIWQKIETSFPLQAPYFSHAARPTNGNGP